MLPRKLMLLSSQHRPAKCLNKPLIPHGVKLHKFNAIVALSTQCIDLIFSMSLCLACFSHLFLAYTYLVW